MRSIASSEQYVLPDKSGVSHPKARAGTAGQHEKQKKGQEWFHDAPPFLCGQQPVYRVSLPLSSSALVE